MTAPTLPNPVTKDKGETTFWAVIPAGGAGTRLWPLSRAARPKFLLPLLGERSLLQQTVDRLALLTTPERTLVVCGEAHAEAIGEQAARLLLQMMAAGDGTRHDPIRFEPELVIRKSTAPPMEVNSHV